MGRHDEAVAEIKHAQEIDPLSPIIFVEGAYIFFYSSHYDQSIEQCKKALALNSNYIGAHLWLTRNYIQKELYEKAFDEIKIVESLTGEKMLFEAAMLYASMGNGREAIQIVDDLIMKSDQEDVDSYDLAAIYCLLNDKEQAFSWLERAYKERSYGMTFLKVSPYWNMLRSDPRFSELLKKMNLE
jgi:tetratricopeptide (TPR) repeat protein